MNTYEKVRNAYLRIDACMPTVMDSMEIVDAEASKKLALVLYALEEASTQLQQAMDEIGHPQ